MRNLASILATVILLAAPSTGEAAQASACENECAGIWASCLLLTFPNEAGMDWCDGFLEGCLIGCNAPPGTR